MPELSFWTVFAFSALLAVAAFAVPAQIRCAAVDGFRCASRHRAVISVPVVFALAYGIFQWVAQASLVHRSGQSVTEWAVFMPVFGNINPASNWQLILLGAVERTAALGNDLVFVFPLSAWIVLLALVFRTRLVIAMIRALRARFCRSWLLLVLAIALCSACAAIKPFLYLFLPEILEFFAFDPNRGFALAGAINVLAMFFEIFAGTYVTVAIMILTFCWIRGMDVDRQRLHFFAARRMGYVMKWVLVTMALSLVLFGVPLLLQSLDLPIGWRDELSRWTDSGARLSLTGILLVFFPMQAILTFHNRSLRAAILKSLALLRRNFALLLTFFGGCFLGFWTLGFAADLLAQAMDRTSSPGIAANGFFLVLSSALGGWLLVVWVCLYRRLGSRSKTVVF